MRISDIWAGTTPISISDMPQTMDSAQTPVNSHYKMASLAKNK